MVVANGFNLLLRLVPENRISRYLFQLIRALAASNPFTNDQTLCICQIYVQPFYLFIYFLCFFCCKWIRHPLACLWLVRKRLLPSRTGNCLLWWAGVWLHNGLERGFWTLPFGSCFFCFSTGCCWYRGRPRSSPAVADGWTTTAEIIE